MKNKLIAFLPLNFPVPEKFSYSKPWNFLCTFVPLCLCAFFSFSSSANTAQAQYQYIPQEYRDYFYNVLTPAIRERCAVIGEYWSYEQRRYINMDTPSVCGWYDPVDTIIKEGSEGWKDKCILSKGKKDYNIYFRDANGTGLWDEGEYIWKDVNGNQEFDFGIDIEIDGSPSSANTGEWGRRNGLYYYDANNNGNWDDGEALWVDHSPGIISDMNTFHQTLTSLIPQFVNHTDSDGDWTGRTTAIPNWTEENILTAIGKPGPPAIRILPTNIKVLCSWYSQQYNILNMLKWTQDQIYGSDCDPSTDSNSTCMSKETIGSDWTEAVNHWLDLPYVSKEHLSPGIVNEKAGYDEGKKFINTTYLIYETNSPVKFNCTIYLYPVYPFGTWTGIWHFLPLNDSEVPNTFNLYKNYNSDAFNYTINVPEPADIESAIITPPYPADGETYARGDVWTFVNTPYTYIIKKFDGPNGFHPLTETPATETSNIEDTNRDDLVDVGTDIDGFGADMGTAVFDARHPEPQIFIPLAVTQLDQLPVHAYFMQGGFNHTEYIYDYNFWTQANIAEDGMLQTYSLNSRAGLNTFIVKDDEHVKRIDVIRPRGNKVTFEFAWNSNDNAFVPIGYPIGVNEKRTYVLRDLTPEDDGDLDFDLYFDSGIIHHFNDSNSGFIDKVSHIDGRQTSISYNFYYYTSAVGTTVTVDFTNSTVSSPKYDAVIEWDNGHIARVKYNSKLTDASTNQKKTVTSELTYDEENKKIVGLENSEFSELSFSIENNKITFGSGNTLEKAGDSIIFTPDGGAPVKTTAVLNTNGLPTSTTIEANENTATTTHEYIDSTERYSNGSPIWGKVSKITRTDGYSETYEYDANTGWLTKVTSPFAGMEKTIEYGYEGQTHTEHLLERPAKTEEKIAGTRTALSMFSYSGTNGERTTETRSLDSGRTLTCTTDRNTYGPPSIYTPTGNYYYYSCLDGGCLTVRLYAPDRWEEQVISPFDTVIRKEVKKGDNLDLRTTLDTVESANPAKINIDSFGRPLKVTHLDGSSEEFKNYGYYGPASVVKKINGLREDEVKYTYDAMGRAVKVESDAQTLDYTYDSLGNTTSTAINGTVTNISSYDAQGRITSSTDAVGTTHYAYTGKSVTSTNPEGKTVITNKYMDGTLSSISGTATVPVSYDYGVDPAKGSWVKEIRGETWTITYYNMLRQAHRTETSTGYWTQNTYDNAGRLNGSYDSEGRVSSDVYNAKNEISRQTVNGVVTDFTNTVTQKNGKNVFQNISTVHNSAGNIVSVNESAVTGWEQWNTVNGRTTHVVTTPKGAGNYTTLTTDFEGNISTEEISRKSNSSNINGFATITSEYDGLGRTISTQDSRKPNANTFTYRPKTDQIASATSSDGSKSSCKYSSGKYAPSSFIPTGEAKSLGLKYTGLGSLEKIIGSGVFDASNIFDDLNRQTGLNTKGEAGPALTSLVYDEASSRLKEKWIAGQKCYEFEYAADGRIKTFKKNISGSDSVKNVIYTPAPNFFYSGYTWSDGTPSVTISGHDSFGQPETISTGGVCTHEFSYNPDSQILSVKFASNLTGNNNISYGYQNLRRSQMTSGNNVVNYTYESGRLKKITSDDIEAEYSYVPQSVNLIDKITMKKGGTVALIRDIDWQTNADRISSVTNKSGSGQIYNSFAYEYNQKGKITKIARESGTERRYSYDDRGQLENAARYLGNVKLAGDEFAYLSDSIGNILYGGRKKMDGSKSVQFAPNVFNNIDTRIVGNSLEVSGSVTPDATVPENAAVTVSVNNAKAAMKDNAFSVTVDANNLDSAIFKSLNVVGVFFAPEEVPEVGGGQSGNVPGTDVVATVNGSVLIPKASENPVYDLGGRLVSTSLWNYSWNSEDRLISVESCIGTEAQRHKVEFAYDHAGRRIRKQVFSRQSSASDWQLATTHFYYYDQVLLNGQPADFGLLTNEAIVYHQTNETTNLQYLWGLDINGSYQGLGGNGGLLCVIEKGGDGSPSRPFFPLMDAKGTIYGYIDKNGSQVAKFAYDPYGKITSSSVASNCSPDSFSFAFQSKYYDQETQCYYFGFRYYDPATCRWLNRDPIEESGGLNLYAYCDNDPVNSMDYLGLAGYFFDGTGNDKNQANLGGKTNVAKLLELYDGLKFYYPGVGTKGVIDRKVGGATGSGGQERIQNAWKNIVDVYNDPTSTEEDKQIDIVGFSRGSSLARAFVNKILSEGIPVDENRNYWDSTGYVHKSYKRVFPKIRFLGLFDTVGSFGLGGNDTNVGYNLTISSPNIQLTSHAIAADEKRSLFPLTSIYSQGEAFSPNKIEKSFPGAHSDVGGGYTDYPEASYAPLKWMWGQGKSVGVPFDPIDPKIIKYLNSGMTPTYHDSRLGSHLYDFDIMTEFYLGSTSRNIYWNK